MYSGIGKLVLVIALPFILGKFVLFVKAVFNWKQHVVFFRKTTTAEKLALAVLAAYIAKLAVDLGSPAQSYFAKTATNIDSPAYLIRNKFREYVQSREVSDKKFLDMMAYRKRAIQDDTNPEALEKIYSPHTKLEQEYINLENLSMDLRNSETRRRYVMFGPEALDCEVCGKNAYFPVALIAPIILKEYLLALFVIGIVTIFPHKATWRYAMGGLCVLFMAYETFEWGFSTSMTLELYAAPETGNQLIRLEQMASIRNALFLIIAVLTLTIDFQVSEDPTVVVLRSAVQQIETASAKLQLSRLARMATMADDTLRKFCWDHYRKTEQQNQHLFNDPQYKKLQSELAQKYKMDEIFERSDKTMEAAFNVFVKPHDE